MKTNAYARFLSVHLSVFLLLTAHGCDHPPFNDIAPRSGEISFGDVKSNDRYVAVFYHIKKNGNEYKQRDKWARMAITEARGPSKDRLNAFVNASKHEKIVFVQVLDNGKEIKYATGFIMDLGQVLDEKLTDEELIAVVVEIPDPVKMETTSMRGAVWNIAGAAESIVK